MVSTRSNGVRSIQTPATTASGTPSITVSPLLSSHNSVVPETPDTSDIDPDPKVLKIATKSLATSLVNTRKRLAEDAQDDQGSDGRRSATKRRIIQKAMFVEIPIKSATANSKARITFLLPPSMLSAIDVQQATPLKGKGRALAPSNINDEDVQLISEDELDYNEDLEESEDSDSEFEPFTLALKNRELSVVDDSEGDEDLMVAAAIELSRETARLAAQEYSGIGSSSRAVASSSRKITKKATAVERRLTKTSGKAKGKGKGRAAARDDGDFIPVESESELSVLSSSEDEVQLSKSKGKTCIVTEPMTWVTRAERRRQQAAERRVAKKEEWALMQELGRKLTWVLPPFSVGVIF